MTTSELVGELDHARITLRAIERLIGNDAEATLLAADLRERLTKLADALDGEE